MAATSLDANISSPEARSFQQPTDSTMSTIAIQGYSPESQAVFKAAYSPSAGDNTMAAFGTPEIYSGAPQAEYGRLPSENPPLGTGTDLSNGSGQSTGNEATAINANGENINISGNNSTIDINGSGDTINIIGSGDTINLNGSSGDTINLNDATASNASESPLTQGEQQIGNNTLMSGTSGDITASTDQSVISQSGTSSEQGLSLPAGSTSDQTATNLADTTNNTTSNATPPNGANMFAALNTELQNIGNQISNLAVQWGLDFSANPAGASDATPGATTASAQTDASTATGAVSDNATGGNANGNGNGTTSDSTVGSNTANGSASDSTGTSTGATSSDTSTNPMTQALEGATAQLSPPGLPQIPAALNPTNPNSKLDPLNPNSPLNPGNKNNPINAIENPSNPNNPATFTKDALTNPVKAATTVWNDITSLF